MNILFLSDSEFKENDVKSESFGIKKRKDPAGFHIIMKIAAVIFIIGMCARLSWVGLRWIWYTLYHENSNTAGHTRECDN